MSEKSRQVFLGLDELTIGTSIIPGIVVMLEGECRPWRRISVHFSEKERYKKLALIYISLKQFTT